jgi:hypothetical protein
MSGLQKYGRKLGCLCLETFPGTKAKNVLHFQKNGLKNCESLILGIRAIPEKSTAWPIKKECLDHARELKNIQGLEKKSVEHLKGSQSQKNIKENCAEKIIGDGIQTEQKFSNIAEHTKHANIEFGLRQSKVEMGINVKLPMSIVLERLNHTTFFHRRNIQKYVMSYQMESPCVNFIIPKVVRKRNDWLPILRIA